MSRLNINNLTNENEDGSPRISGISTFSSAHYFVPPSGTKAERPSDPGEGMIRFNTDSGHLEYYTGEFWDDVIVNNNDLGGGTGSNTGTGTRGVFAGGYSPARTNIIDYVTISTLGDAQDFGDLLVATEYPAGTSDSTRGLVLGGQTSAIINTVVYITIASTGDAQDFGDLIGPLRTKSALANSTRAISSGGQAVGSGVGSNIIEYLTIQSKGDTNDFGDLSAVAYYQSCAASSTRGIFAGHSSLAPPTSDNTIDYVTIATTGNALDFGDLDYSGSGSGLSNSTRGVFSRGGSTELDYVTIATLGNSQDFGTLTGDARYNTDAAVSSSTRGLFMVGAPEGNTINYITILSTGNAQDFGDLTRAPGGDAGFSNGHGGL